MIAPPPNRRATFDDLLREEHRAELVAGRIVRISLGILPVLVSHRIVSRLGAWAEAEPGRGMALPEGVIFRAPELASGRESFNPDGSYATGPFPADLMDVYQGAPAFAVEVRSADGFGPVAETEAAAKRADYFAAGTRVVWDVDPVNRFIDRYRADAPATPVRFGPDDEADAETAVPGWRLRPGDVM